MKGKHQRSRQHRTALATAATIERLRGEIEREASKAATARKHATQTATARTLLSLEERRNQERLRPLTDHVGKLAAAAGPGSAAIKAALRELNAIEHRLTKHAGNRAIEQIAQAGLKARPLDVHRSGGQAYLSAWYQKKTGRRLKMHRDVSLEGWVPDGTPNQNQDLAPYATCTVRDTTPAAYYTWAIPPWTRPPSDTSDAATLRTKLGATTAGAPTLPTRPMPGAPLRADATISTPWRHTPIVSQPSDAVDLAYWYRRSAFAHGWRPDTAAVPFWLPAEHSVSYPQARPLPHDTDLRLPYPMVFVAFAAPWQLSPAHTDQSDPARAAQVLMMYARGRAAEGHHEPLYAVLGRLQATGSIDRCDLPTPLQAIDSYGSLVEGLLLAAHPDGTPDDDFAWCVTINHPSGLPLGRIAVPASRRQTTWRHQVDNIIAAIALSCWHETTEYSPPQSNLSSDELSDEQDCPEIAVRILDVDATSPRTGDRDHHERPAPRAHLRRGHWRRLTVADNPNIRWTWVRPTTVNGSHITTRQVYVLPTGSGHP
jgi:hypothetical protein